MPLQTEEIVGFPGFLGVGVEADLNGILAEKSFGRSRLEVLVVTNTDPKVKRLGTICMRPG